MEGTRHGESAVYGHAPPLDARSRKRRQKGEPPKAGESAASAARSTPDAHTHGVGLAARAVRERERPLSAQQRPDTGRAVRGWVLPPVPGRPFR
jgi:hypothetical protein